MLHACCFYRCLKIVCCMSAVYMRASQMYAACVHATQCSTLSLGWQVHLSCSHAQILGGSTHSAYVQNMVKISAAYTPHMSWLLTLCVPHACSIFVRVGLLARSQYLLTETLNLHLLEKKGTQWTEGNSHYLY